MRYLNFSLLKIDMYEQLRNINIKSYLICIILIACYLKSMAHKNYIKLKKHFTIARYLNFIAR